MLDGDELPSALGASEAFRDRALPQFWDGAQKLGHEVAHSLGADGWTAWDIYLFYPPGAEWSDQGLPAPEAALAQVGGVVVGTKGTLPAVSGEARIPKRLSDRADVVGAQDELDGLLSRVAVSFAKRYLK
jgi:hypothetical protein